uniref:Uncharacterized protein n=1 Tax=viral metagenome TaxID=1070528 RepID=A0A6C0BFZ9_9ZZZZ
MDCSKTIESIKTKSIPDVFNELLLLHGTVKKMTKALVYAFCYSFHDSNIWSLNIVHNVLSDLENNKCNNHEGLCVLIDLMQNIEQKNYNIHTLDKDITISWLHSIHYDNSSVIDAYSTVIKDSFIDILSLFIHFIDTKDPKRSIIMLQHIFSLKPKDIFVSPNNNIYWFIFDILLNKTTNTICKDYVGITRDLFFYKMTKREHQNILHVIYNCVLIVIHNRTKNQMIDISSLKVYKKADRMEYLYFLPNYDDELVNIVQNEKQKAQIATRKKTLNIKCKDLEKIKRLQAEMNIVKLNNFSEYYK